MLYQGERENDEITIEMIYEGSTYLLETGALETVKYEIKIVPTQTEYYLKEKIWSNGNLFFEKEGKKSTTKTKKEFYTAMTVFDDLDLELFFSYSSFNSPVFADFHAALNALSCINSIDTSLTSLIRKPVLSVPENEIVNGGSNLVQVLNTLKINDKKTYKKIVEALQRVNPHFQDFDFRPYGTNFEMLLEENGLNRSMHLSKVSDGTLRYLCLITLLLANRKSILCIDESETGLHPDMLYNLAEAIKEASQTTMVVISTHSTQLLNYFDLETVRVFEKDADNSTQVYAYTEGDFKGWYDTFQVGTMWRQGDIGGNRYGN